tara:strand:+ start:3617 stop:4123 length:507 start_codon:yes stop_codon:yes gene_type:complete
MINNLLLLATIIIIPFHDFHVTHTTLHYNNNLKAIEITIKVAIEDLERTLENEYSKKLRLGTKQEEKKVSQEIIKDYFNNNLTFLTNKKEYQYHWIGKEISDNLHDIYLYFEIPNYFQNDQQKYLTIENTLFLETYIEQTNIVLIKIEDKNYNLTFTKDNDIQKIFFK